MTENDLILYSTADGQVQFVHRQVAGAAVVNSKFTTATHKIDHNRKDIGVNLYRALTL